MRETNATSWITNKHSTMGRDSDEKVDFSLVFSSQEGSTKRIIKKYEKVSLHVS